MRRSAQVVVAGVVAAGCALAATPAGAESPALAAHQSIVADCPASASGLRSLSAEPTTIRAGAPVVVNVTGLRAGQAIELQGYSQNHEGTMTFEKDPTPIDRRPIADAAGTATVRDLRLGSNTRLRARLAGCPSWRHDDVGTVVNVRVVHALTVERLRPMTYRLTGRALPGRDDGLLVGLYRIMGTPCAEEAPAASCTSERLAGQVRAAADGRWQLTLRLPATDTGQVVRFAAKTGQDAQNAPGRSPVASFRPS